MMSFTKMALAGIVMAESIWFVNRGIGSNAGAGAWARIIAGAVVGPAIYVALVIAMGSPELDHAQRAIARRRR
jgi:hypothetical protein